MIAKLSEITTMQIAMQLTHFALQGLITFVIYFITTLINKFKADFFSSRNNLFS